MRMLTDLVSRLARLIFSAALALVLIGGGHVASGQAPVPPAPASATAVDNFLALAEEAESVVAGLKTLQPAIPRTDFDPSGVLAEVGRDPAALGGWVRENTDWVPYEGVLRGPAGVLMDRAGNSLDRSLLLAELLRLSGYRVQLVRSDEPVRWADQPAVAEAGDVPDDMAEIEALAEIAQRAAIPLERLRHRIVAYEIEGARLAEDVAIRVAWQTDWLTKLIGGARTARAGATAAEERHRWWVQYQADDRWVDLTPDGKPAGIIAGDATALDDTGRPALPEELFHTLELRVVVQARTGAGDEERTALSHSMRPADLAGQAVRLAFVPIDFPTPTQLLADPNPQSRMREALAAQKEWLPVLMVGGDQVMYQSFTDEARLNKRDARNPAAEVGSRASGLTGGLGAALGGGGSREEGAADLLAAVHVDFIIHTPGHPPVTKRRLVYAAPADAAPRTRLDPAQKLSRGLALLGHTDFLPLACDLSEGLLLAHQLEALFSNFEILGDLKALRRVPPLELADRLGRLTEGPGPLHDLAVARRAWGPGDTYLDRINVLARHRVFSDMGEAIGVTDGFDIVANDVAVLPDADAFTTRLRQGLTDTNAEAVLAGGDGSAAANAALAAVRDAGPEAWLVVRDAADARWRALEVPRYVRTLVEQDLGAGRVVVICVTAGTPCWWQVDSDTGQTIGMNARGWGGMEENIILIRKAFYMGDVLACFATTIFSGSSPEEMALKLAICGVSAVGKGTNLFTKSSKVGKLLGNRKARRAAQKAADKSASLKRAAGGLASDAGGLFSKIVTAINLMQ